jgi:hypothetical protein
MNLRAIRRLLPESRRKVCGASFAYEHVVCSRVQGEREKCLACLSVTYCQREQNSQKCLVVQVPCESMQHATCDHIEKGVKDTDELRFTSTRISINISIVPNAFLAATGHSKPS